jgi:hypothetical protein
MFNTNGQQLKEGGVSKSIQPGVVYARIYSGKLRTSGKGDKKCLELFLETEPLPNFEGWPIDRNAPDGAKFKGQVGRVSATMWTDQFNENNLTKNEIMAKLTAIAQELGLRDQLNGITATTIDEWADKAIALVSGHFAWWFIKGTEEEYEGKTILKLSLPKYKYVSIDPTKLDKFDKTNKYHFKPLEVKPVSGFAPAGNDFDLD